MTEVPEHLLRRSRERRAAIGGGGGGEAAPAAAEAPAAAAATPAPAAAEAPAAAAAPAAPAVVEEPVAAVPQPTRRIPLWVYPVLGLLPFWAFVYFGAFGTRGETGPVDPLVLGQQVYQSAGCGGCHGASGQGQGDFPKLADGEVVKTFPNEADHIKWVQTGSTPFKGQPYGDPNREGGQHVAKTGGMPGFAGSLSQEEIEAVVKYEREGL